MLECELGSSHLSFTPEKQVQKTKFDWTEELVCNRRGDDLFRKELTTWIKHVTYHTNVYITANKLLRINEIYTIHQITYDQLIHARIPLFPFVQQFQQLLLFPHVWFKIPIRFRTFGIISVDDWEKIGHHVTQVTHWSCADKEQRFHLCQVTIYPALDVSPL